MLPIFFLLQIVFPTIRISLNISPALMALKKDIHIVIIRDEQEFPVDRDKICQESIMIKAGLESGMEEERTGRFTHMDFGAATVQRMVKWVNDRSYHVAEEGGHRGLSDARKRGYLTFDEDLRVINDILLAHVDVHGIAEFYCMENLKAYARKRFDDAARFGWHEDGFLHVVREVYRTTADRPYGADLRDMLCDYALKWRTQLLMFSDDLKNDPVCRNLVR